MALMYARALRLRFGVALLAALVALALAPPSFAQTKLQAPLPDKPFADHHLVVQLSDRTPAKQALALSVPYNLLKFYEPGQDLHRGGCLRTRHRSVARQ